MLKITHEQVGEMSKTEVEVSVKVKDIEWLEERPADKIIRHGDVFGETPLGKFIVTWEDREESIDYYVECENHINFCGPFTSLDDAKEYAQTEYERLVLSCLKPETSTCGEKLIR